ncbi:MAG: phosphoadenylyl-sulfate reductase [Candidatus Nanopelagicales bacterium]
MTTQQQTAEQKTIAQATAERGAQHLANLETDGLTGQALSQAALEWAATEFGAKLGLLSSMGDEALVHLASEAVPGLDVLFLDTGYHFAETLGTRDAYAATRPINLINVLPLQTVAEQDAEYGEKLHNRDPGQCCQLRKVEPMNRALEDYDAWVTGMRRVDAPTRANIGIIEYDDKRDKVKINPLAMWSDEDLQAYIEANSVLLNTLRESGYESIGCEPCTRPTAPGEDPRAGRWAGTNKTECGLHT